jgi:acyl-CoA hydrolase
MPLISMQPIPAQRESLNRHEPCLIGDILGVTVMGWEKQLVTPEQVFQRMRPGMRVFLGTGAAEPRTLVQHLMASHSNRLQDQSCLAFSIGPLYDALARPWPPSNIWVSIRPFSATP